MGYEIKQYNQDKNEEKMDQTFLYSAIGNGEMDDEN